MNTEISKIMSALAVFSIFAIGTAAAANGQPAKAENPTAVAGRMKPLADALSALKGGTPAPGRIKQALSAWQKLSDSEKERLRQDIVFMAGAGFLAAGDMASFGKARSGIDDMEAFQTETTEHCRECDGSGILKSRCSSCNGSGRCSRCGGSGSISGPRLSGMGAAASMTCSTCHGSGTCPDCDHGTRETRHNACNGSGKRISQPKCLTAFETHRAKAAEEVFAIMQEANGLVLRNGEWVPASETAEPKPSRPRASPLPTISDGVVVPFANNEGISSLLYLGSYKTGKLSMHVFYEPPGNGWSESLYILAQEFDVLPKLGWTAYLTIEGASNIDKFHEACTAAVRQFGQMDSRARTARNPGVQDVSVRFPDVSFAYFSTKGKSTDMEDLDPSRLQAFYLPGEIEHGEWTPGTLLIAAKVTKRTGLQKWRRTEPFSMNPGIMLCPGASDSDPIETFLSFSERRFLERAVKQASSRRP